MFDINYYNNKFKENISTNDSMVEIQDTIININRELGNKLGKNETAASANKLATPVTINGVEFDGTENITVSNMRLV